MDQKTEIFKRILLDYQDKIYRLCRSNTHSDSDCEDLFQNILMKIWKSLDSLKKDSAINTWIYRISINASIDYRRQHIKERQYSSGFEVEELHIIDTSGDTEKVYSKQERIELLFKAVAKLSYLEQTLISLYLEDLKYKEIADILGISEKNVSVKISRIKKKLSAIINARNNGS